MCSLSLIALIQLQVNEEASNKVLEVEQKYNEIRKPVYVRRNEMIQKIPDFWLTAVCNISLFLELVVCMGLSFN